MSDDLPHKWHKPLEPNTGIYTLVMLARHTRLDGSAGGPLYVCTSDEGYLSEAFATSDPAWQPYYK
jgi:hypothetical protein